MEIALIKLLLAHLLGDFFLQPDQWVAEKEALKLKSNKLYLHIAIHTAMVFLVFFSFDVWKQALTPEFIAEGRFVVLSCGSCPARGKTCGKYDTTCRGNFLLWARAKADCEEETVHGPSC